MVPQTMLHIRDHAFFEQPVFQGEVGDAFLQSTGFAAQILHFAGGRGTGSVTGQAALALRVLVMPPA